MTDTKLSDTGLYILLHNYSIVMNFHRFNAPSARCSTAAPKHNQATSCVLFYGSLFFIGQPRADDACEEWLESMHAGKFQSKVTEVQSVTHAH